MTFAEYYNGPFRQDLGLVLAALPPGHNHGPDEVTVQPRLLSNLNSVIQAWRADHRMAFAGALFLTVLVDQVCFTHFGWAYPRFRALTQYPKLRGDCPGGCYTHINPATVFVAIGQPLGRLGAMADAPLAEIPDDFFSTMRREVVTFVEEHLPEVDSEAFWEACDREIPLDLRLLYMTSRARTVE